MKSKVIFTGLAALLVLVLISPGKPTAARGLDYKYHFGFESFEKPPTSWKTTSNTPFSTTAFSIVSGENGCPDMLGNQFAVLKSSPVASKSVADIVPYPIGTWALTALPAGGRNIVSIDYSAKSVSGCDGCLPMVYIGPTPPTSSSQFATLEDGRYLKTYWQSFHHNAIVFQGVIDTVYVALGWPGINASIGLDCINVTITPIE
jgi:hypothetical protein